MQIDILFRLSLFFTQLLNEWLIFIRIETVRCSSCFFVRSLSSSFLSDIKQLEKDDEQPWKYILFGLFIVRLSIKQKQRVYSVFIYSNEICSLRSFCKSDSYFRKMIAVGMLKIEQKKNENVRFASSEIVFSFDLKIIIPKRAQKPAPMRASNWFEKENISIRIKFESFGFFFKFHRSRINIAVTQCCQSYEW